MAKFIYKAKIEPEKVIKGTIEAETETAAVNRLNQKGYFPISLTREDTDFILLRKIRSQDLAIFTRQLSTLLESGLTLIKALGILRSQTEDKYLQAVIEEVSFELKDGQLFSEALKRFPNIFSHLYISTIKAGEVGGALEKALSHLADFTESEQELRNKVRGAIVYPILMAIVGLVTMIVLLTFVVPRLVTIFEDLGGTLPLPTKILIDLSKIFTGYWWLISGVGLFIFFIIREKKFTRNSKFAIDRFKLNFPLWGALIKEVEMARFGRTLGMLLSNGVGILQAIRVTSETVETEVIRQKLKNIEREVSEGSTLTKSIIEEDGFPSFVANMVAVGEESGGLEKSLFKIALIFEKKVAERINVMTSLLEPMMILVIGSMVGFMVISMLLPIFQINLMAK